MLSANALCQSDSRDSLTLDTVTTGETNTQHYPGEDDKNQFDLVTHLDKQKVQDKQIPDTLLNKLRNDDAFWYVNTQPVRQQARVENNTPAKNLYNQEWFKTAFWIILIFIFAAVLFWFFRSGKQLFKKLPATDKINESVPLAANIFSIDYDSEIKKAISSKDYRLSIRLMYLQTLKQLSENNIIRYKQDLTNSDYVVQLFNTCYYKDFFSLTRSFEYACYGHFSINELAFSKIKNDFSNFNQRLS
ncbi:MAG: hypothetical protein ABR502_06915 [Chitinophagaceae bacterium]